MPLFWLTKLSTEKFDSLTGVPLSVISFPIAAFKIVSLSLTFDIVVIYISVGLFGFILFAALWAS